MNTFINIENVSLKFRIYRNPIPSLKETFVNLMTRKSQKLDDVVEFFALDNISLNIPSGQRLGIIGLNGAGKSTLLKSIAGVYTPQQGQIVTCGWITPLIELGAGFDPEKTGLANIYLNGALFGKSQTKMKPLESKIIEFSELGDFINLPVKYYSSGMYIRLAFSIATSTTPDILLMDEILAAGDVHFVHKAYQRIQELINTSQIVVFVSHNLEEVKNICNWVVVMDHGKVVNQGNPIEMIKFYINEIAK
jgi:ABC-type polysaccharide/polyol phosphate transport system ATPase subunit